MSNVLMIVQNDFINDSRIIKEATSLGENGHNVKVLALHNKGLEQYENFGYFQVERIFLKTRGKLGKNKISQMFKYIEFMNECVRRGREFKPDIIHCHDVYTLPIGEKLIKKLKNKPKFIYDSHELWSEASNNLTMPKILLNRQNRIERRVIKQCDAVITVSESIVNFLQEKYKLKYKPTLIRNIPLKKESIENKDIFRKVFNIESNKKIVLYQGAVGKGRGIEALIEAMGKLNDDIVMVILGNGNKVEEYKKLVSKKALSNRVFFHRAVTPDVLIDYTASADLGMSMIMNTCLSYYYSLPNKMFEYIQAELPVICSNYPDMNGIINKYGVGETADPKDAESVAKAISNIFKDNKKYLQCKNNCKKAKKELNWQNESKKLNHLYDRIS